MLSEKYDLKEFYDTCDVERSVGEFKPDLYLYHSGFSNRRGVFIEIKVTHESTDKKKNSENKIIEIHVQSDVELRELLKGEIIENKEIRFMGFKQECRKEILLSKRMLFRFFYIPMEGLMFQIMKICHDVMSENLNLRQFLSLIWIVTSVVI